MAEDNTVFRFLSAGAYWSINKYVARAIGIAETVMLMEHVSFAEKYQNEHGWYHRSREVLLEVLPLSDSSQKRKERFLVDLELIQKEQRGQERKNWYKLNERNLGLFILDPIRYVKEKFPEHNTDDNNNNSGNSHTETDSSKKTSPEQSQAVKLTSSTAQFDRSFNNKVVKNNKEDVFLKKNKSSDAAESVSEDSKQPQILVKSKRILGNQKDDVTRSARNIGNPSDSVEKSKPIRVGIRKKVFKTQISAAAASVRQRMKKAACKLQPKVDPAKIGNRKLFPEAVAIIKYWNDKPHLNNHILFETDGVYKWGAQTKTVKIINQNIFQLLRGELYINSTDIKQTIVRTMKFTVDQVYKAIDRMDLACSPEYGALAFKKPSLLTFFYNPRSHVYFDKDEKSTYRYKYAFLHFLNGDVRKPEHQARKSPHEGVVTRVIDRIKKEGILINGEKRNKISEAVDIAMSTMLDNKRTWKFTEDKMMLAFPGLLFTCYKEKCKRDDFDGLKAFAKFSFKQYLEEKRYI